MKEISDLKLENNQVDKKKLLALLVILALIMIFVGLYFYYLKNYIIEDKVEKKALGKKQIYTLTPTYFPFEEMTIPYLRSRNYVSNLADLSQVSSNPEYTSYLTSYDSEGFKINGLLTKPIAEQPNGGFPAIIFIHGYIPPKRYQTLNNYYSFVDYFAKNGFVVFKIDLRGHGNSEGEASGAYYSSDYIIDTLNAISALEKSDFVNSKKIGLWGHSMAGNIISRALAARPKISAVSIWSGAVFTYSDFEKYKLTDYSYVPPISTSPSRTKRDKLFNVYGRFDAKSSFWKMVPMTNYLHDIEGAIQLNHTIDDSVVSVEYSRGLNKILNETSIPHELNEYAVGGHNFTGGTFYNAMKDTVDFFNKYLNK